MSYENEVADAIRLAFTSDVDYDEQDAQPNVVDALVSIARALTKLGNADASTPFGAIEALGKAILDSNERIANALGDVADAIRESREKK